MSMILTVNWQCYFFWFGYWVWRCSAMWYYFVWFQYRV